jgi:hypothetical protein
MALSKKPIVTAVKKPYLPVEITDEEIEEFSKCAVDPIYFITNYVYITSPKYGSIKFRLFPYQYDIINAFHAHRFNVLLAARQMGKCVTSDTEISVDGNEIEIGEIVYPSLTLVEKLKYHRDQFIQYLLKKVYK